MRIYQHSGKVPPTGAAMALAAGVLASAALGIVYSFSFYYIPYVYLNFALAAGFGAASGWVVGFCAKEGKIRNVGAVALLAMLATVVGIYAEWGSTVYAMYPFPELPQLWARLGISTFHPLAIIHLMQMLFAQGSWGLAENANVTGWPLVALWLAEIGLVLAASFAAAIYHIDKHPFCEACDEWVSGHAPHFYTGDGTEAVWSEVKHGVFETLALTSRAAGVEPTFVRLTLKSCDHCSASNFLTITACRNTIDSKGNKRCEATDLVTNLIIESSQLEIIEAANMIAPAPGESPLVFPEPTGDWTLESEPQSAAAGPLA